MKVRVFHKTVIDKEELFPIGTAGILRLPDKSFYVYQGCRCFKSYEVIINLLTKNPDDPLPEIPGTQIVYFILVMKQQKPDLRMSNNDFLELNNNMSHLGIFRLQEFPPGRDIKKKILYRETGSCGTAAWFLRFDPGAINNDQGS